MMFHVFMQEKIDDLMLKNPETASDISPNDPVGVIFGKDPNDPVGVKNQMIQMIQMIQLVSRTK